MPPRSETDLQTLQAEVRRRIIRSTADALDFLLEALPAGRPKYNQLLSLRSRAEQIRHWQIGNTRPLEQLTVLENELREDVLLFTQHLKLKDFAEAPPARPELRPGHLLYRVPDRMQLRQQHECLIRIAHSLEQVLAGLPQDQLNVTESVPVAEVMEVEIIDPSPADARAFDILLVSDGEQLVDEYSYTEWIFFVRPLLEGQHDLILKVSVLLTVRGKERTKNIVFRRRIAVGTEAATAPTDSDLRQVIAVAPAPGGEEEDTLPPPVSPRLPTRGGTAQTYRVEEPPPPYLSPAPGSPPESQPRQASSTRRWLSIAASLLVIVFAGWWVVNISDLSLKRGTEQKDPVTEPFPVDPSDSMTAPVDTLRSPAGDTLR